VRSIALRALIAVVLVPLGALAACGGTATPEPSYPAGAIVVTADARKFDTAALVVPAGSMFTLVLVNREADAHNIAIRTQSGFDGDIVYRNDPISASTAVLEVGPIAQGSYFFLCEVHSTMSGTVEAR